MFTSSRKVIGVWVFTAYDDGNVDVTQTAPDKAAFEHVKRAIANIQRWCAKTMKAQDKCPYSPNNPVQLNDDNVSKKDDIT